MTQISTVAELEALPENSVVLDNRDGAWQMKSGEWYHPGESWWESKDLLGLAPLTLIYRPDAGQTRVMVRCASDGCMDAHALPSGAFYLCPQHRGHITLGRDSR